MSSFQGNDERDGITMDDAGRKVVVAVKDEEGSASSGDNLLHHSSA